MLLTTSQLTETPPHPASAQLLELFRQIPTGIAIVSQYIEATPLVLEHDRRVNFDRKKILNYVARREGKEGIGELEDGRLK